MTTPKPSAVPVAGDVVGPAIDAMRTAMPAIEPHLDDGHWGDMVEGWRGQFEFERARIADEFLASRRATAEDDALTEVCQSEYDTPREQARAAVGEVRVRRTVVHYVAGRSITAADASSEATALALLAAIQAWGAEHQASVWDPLTGLGSHVSAVLFPWTAPATPAYSDVINSANIAVGSFFNHNNGGGHKSPDPAVTAATIQFAVWEVSGPDTYAGATARSRSSLFSALNTIKRLANRHTLVAAPAGVIRRGHRFEVRANLVAVPPIQPAQFVVSRDTFVATGEEIVRPRVDATQTGLAANQPLWARVVDKTVLSLDALYDSGATLRLAPDYVTCAGGHDGQADDVLRRSAGAAWTGKHGPTQAALLAGALADHGASRAVVRKDTSSGTALVYAVDASWSQSDAWLASVASSLSDPDTGWLGFGCRLWMGGVVNLLIRCELTVVLRDANFMSDTTRIADRIQSAVAAYFNDRPDWYSWKLAAIRGVVARADTRILTCSQARVLDAVVGTPVAEPTAPAAAVGTGLIHYFLGDNAVQMTFSAPA
jgi:hypothetical protein